jgi:hypothetical protein
MKIRVERADDAPFDASVFKDVRIAGRTEVALIGMDDIPAIPVQKLDCGARKALVEQQSDHAASSGWI